MQTKNMLIDININSYAHGVQSFAAPPNNPVVACPVGIHT